MTVIIIIECVDWVNPLIFSYKLLLPIYTKQIVVKAHGSAKIDSLVSAIEQVKDFKDQQLLTKIGNVMENNQIIEE